MYDIITKIVDKLKDLPGAVETFKESLPGGASEQYVDDAVAAAVDGLASENYVDTAVTGLASESYVDTAVTGLASETYVGTAISNAVDSIDLGDVTTLAGLKTAIDTAVSEKAQGNIIPIQFRVNTSFDKFGFTGIYFGYVIRTGADRFYGFVSAVGSGSGATLTVRISSGADGMSTSVFVGRESLGINSAQPIEIGASVAIDADVSVALPAGYTYTNTRVLSCYLFVNNTQYGAGYVHWYISNDNKLHAVNKSGSVGAIQAFIARLL